MAQILFAFDWMAVRNRLILISKKVECVSLKTTSQDTLRKLQYRGVSQQSCHKNDVRSLTATQVRVNISTILLLYKNQAF